MEKLTEQEEMVMLHIWQLKECVIKDIVDALKEPQPYSTIASVVRKLEDKGYLNSKRYANVNVYTPKIKEEDYKKKFMSGVVKNYFKNSYKDLVSFFVKEEKLSNEDLKEIIKMIEEGKNK